MTRLRLGTVLLSLLAALSCAASPASGPERGPSPVPELTDPGDAEDGRPVDRPYIYEVAPGQGGEIAAADTISTLEVSGSAEIRVPADRARITFAVETESSTAQEAAEDNAGRMDAAISALRDAGVEGLEIETRGYRIQPRYRRTDDRGTREIDGYTARNLMVATVADVEAVGRLIDTAVDAGANRVASIDFEASDTEEARLRALEEAVQQARRQAEAIAAAMGVGLGPALDVRTGSRVPEPTGRFGAEALSMSAPDTPVEPGEQTVSADVTIRYRLEGP